MEKNDNVLVRLLEIDPSIWQNSKRFKALLSDFLPQNKLYRNLLSVSIEEQIPDSLTNVSSIDNVTIYTLSKRIINACGCGEDVARKVVLMWVSAFDIEIHEADNTATNEEEIHKADNTNTNEKEIHNKLETPSQRFRIEELGISDRLLKFFKAFGCETLEDVKGLSENDIAQIANYGDLFQKDVSQFLKTHGIVPKADLKNPSDILSRIPRDVQEINVEWANISDVAVRALNEQKIHYIRELVIMSDFRFGKMLEKHGFGVGEQIVGRMHTLQLPAVTYEGFERAIANCRRQGDSEPM